MKIILTDFLILMVANLLVVIPAAIICIKVLSLGGFLLGWALLSVLGIPFLMFFQGAHKGDYYESQP